jgi:hypothetical protein
MSRCPPIPTDPEEAIGQLANDGWHMWVDEVALLDYRL